MNYFTLQGYYTGFHCKLLTDCNDCNDRRFDKSVCIMNEFHINRLLLALGLMIWRLRCFTITLFLALG